MLGRLSLHVYFAGQYLNLRILLECPGRDEAAKGAVAVTSRTAVMEVSICSGLRSTETITCRGCSKGCGDPEWLAEYVAERKLKRHRIIKVGNVHYLQGVDSGGLEKFRSKNASVRM